MKIKPVLLLFPVLALSACVGGRQPSLSGPDAGGGKSKNTQAVDKTPVDVTPPDASLLAHPTKPTPESAAKLIRYTYKKGELKSLCDAAIQRTKDALAKIAATPIGEVTFDNSMLAFEAVNADFVDDTGMYGFMKYVSTDKTIQGEGADCETAAGQYQVEIFTDRKMYAVLKAAQPRNAAEKRLAFETLLSFEQSGMSLNDGDLAKYKELSQQLTKLQADYSNNLNLDKSHVDFAPEELAGVPQAFVDAHKKTPDGKITIFATESDYPVVMDNASNEQTRLKMMKSYLTRGGDTNLKLLSDAVVLREQIAKLLLANDSSAADQTWVTYRVKQRMVKTRQTVVDFLDGLRGKLAEGNQKDFAQLLAYKKTIDKNATELNAWDIRYMTNQLKKQSFSVDGEAIRQYFPADVVIQGLFGVYSQMLGVDYKEVPNAKVWADGVKLYEIRDHADNRHIGFFYTDFYPRPDTGKYNHAAAFPIFAGRMLPGGYYDFPVSCIVANISPPVNGQPALLSHDDVETIFHEFGHVMHQTLTRAPYASLAGSAVAQDFVEAPSQMLENWVWQPEILKRLSGLASDHSQHLPDDMLAKMIAARDFQQSALYTKQLLYGTFDINIHSQSGPVDVNKVYNDLYVQIMGQPIVEGQQFPASFGHLMGGYDAGYYGYLWSKVYAQDMFSVFKANGLVSPEFGKRYRGTILEYGNMMDAIDLLPKFLGRAPSKDAFYNDLHIKD